MAQRVTEAVIRAALNGIFRGVASDVIGANGRINAYTGAQPATAATAASGTLIATLTLGNPAFAAASGTSIAANAITGAAAVASGLPGYVRIWINGQTAPGSAATSTDFRIDMAAGVSATLNGAINASVTTIPLVSAQGLPTSGTVLVDSEQISYTGISANSLTGCTRGVNGTTAATHANGAVVYQTGVEFWFSNAAMSGGQIVAGGQVNATSLTYTQPLG